MKWFFSRASLNEWSWKYGLNSISISRFISRRGRAFHVQEGNVLIIYANAFWQVIKRCHLKVDSSVRSKGSGIASNHGSFLNLYCLYSSTFHWKMWYCLISTFIKVSQKCADLLIRIRVRNGNAGLSFKLVKSWLNARLLPRVWCMHHQIDSPPGLGIACTFSRAEGRSWMWWSTPKL